ncbi:MAG: hypothetical protein IPM64_17225 [Phycisphaerales bacterium]|nr:hypothetical protein [Phycisphaerales bacterium]
MPEIHDSDSPVAPVEATIDIPAGPRRSPWWALSSRKVQVAIATMVVSLAARWGFQVDPEIAVTLIGLGAAIILGIAAEDAATKLAASDVEKY